MLQFFKQTTLGCEMSVQTVHIVQHNGKRKMKSIFI